MEVSGEALHKPKRRRLQEPIRFQSVLKTVRNVVVDQIPYDLVHILKINVPISQCIYDQ